jgi:2-aminoadipate transaminase
MEISSIQLEKNSGQSVYRQIASHIRTQIEQGALTEGFRLPPIRSLSVELGVNRDTVALAYETLAAEGWVESSVGRGTFVSRPSPVKEPGGRAAEIELAPAVKQLLAFESGNPRFGKPTDAIALHSLVPDPAFYPVDAFRRTLNRVLSAGGPELFLYGGPQGHPGLRDVVAQRLRDIGVMGGRDQIVLTHGASQGISLAVRLLASPGEAVAVEVPTYQNVLAALAALGVEAVPVAMGTDGADLESLERVVSRAEVKAFYTIPTFHNPLGTTTPVAHRRSVLEIARRAGIAIIEDASEMDLRYMGRAVPPLAALDGSGLVLHLSSFSKSLFPGIRVGAICAQGRVIEGLLALKHATDLSDSMPLQAALAEFLTEGEYERHLNRLRRELRERREALTNALASNMPQGSWWTEPEGGYQLWLELPFEVDTRDLLAEAAQAGVLFAPGSQFLPGRGPSRGLRLTIAQANSDEIARGIQILARVIEERLASEPAALEASRVQL